MEWEGDRDSQNTGGKRTLTYKEEHKSLPPEPRMLKIPSLHTSERVLYVEEGGQGRQCGQALGPGNS